MNHDDVATQDGYLTIRMVGLHNKSNSSEQTDTAASNSATTSSVAGYFLFELLFFACLSRNLMRSQRNSKKRFDSHPPYRRFTDRLQNSQNFFQAGDKALVPGRARVT